MCMKIKGLKKEVRTSHDVCENKGDSCFCHDVVENKSRYSAGGVNKPDQCGQESPADSHIEPMEIVAQDFPASASSRPD